MKTIRTLYALVLAGILAVVLAGCEFPGIAALDRAALDLANQLRVETVRCSTDSLSIADRLTDSGICVAFNTAGTRIEYDDIAAPTGGWRSSNPTAVSITLQGVIRAETQVDTVWIVAEGSFDTADSVQVRSY